MHWLYIFIFFCFQSDGGPESLRTGELKNLRTGGGVTGFFGGRGHFCWCWVSTPLHVMSVIEFSLNIHRTRCESRTFWINRFCFMPNG